MVFDTFAASVCCCGLVAGFYAGADLPGDTRVLPAALIPRDATGRPIAPPPSDARVWGEAATRNRRPGDRIVRHRLVGSRTSSPREFPKVGRATLWELSYCAEIDGPDGKYSFCYDRDLLLVGE